MLFAVALLVGCAGPSATVSPAGTAGSPGAPASPARASQSPRPSSPALPESPTAGATAGDTPSAVPSDAARTPTPTVQATARPSPAEGEFVNPVLDADFPDPHVIEVDGTYYAYATQAHGRNIQVSSSPDMVTWDEPSEALPQRPDWSPGHTWAPEVAQTPAGFVMYYTLAASEFRRPGGQAAQCISYAIAADPVGPFEDPNDEPLVCQADMGGSIDPHPYMDADRIRYLVWKNDGNCCGMPTRIWLQQLSGDGTRLRGDPTDLGVQNDHVWEFNVIEAPTLLLHDATYYLFYSANRYDSGRYAVGYATADRLRGPYNDAEENPILVSGEQAAGTGHEAIIRDADGDYWLYYHAWDEAAVGAQEGGRRALWLDELLFQGGRPVVDGPDVGPQPAPEPVGPDD